LPENHELLITDLMLLIKEKICEKLHYTESNKNLNSPGAPTSNETEKATPIVFSPRAISAGMNSSVVSIPPMMVPMIVKSPGKVHRKSVTIEKSPELDNDKEIDKEFYACRSEERAKAKLMITKAVIGDSVVIKPKQPNKGSPKRYANSNGNTYNLIHVFYNMVYNISKFIC